MRERVCKNCGGRKYTVVGQNMVKCMFCGTLYVDEHASKEEEVLTVGAYEKLRELDFDGALDEFNKILALYPLSFEALYGKALAKNKIVFYTKKRTNSQKARFFGENIPSLQEDEDFKNAVKNAPAEVAKTYTDQAKRIEKIRNSYLEQASKKSCDVFVYAQNYDKDEPENVVAKSIENLQNEGFSTYLPMQREKEEETFRALQTCKVLLFFANGQGDYLDGECRHVYDRYLYFVGQKKKTKSGLILAIDTEKIKQNDLPKVLSSCKSVVDLNSISFLQDLNIKVKKEIENSTIETAKIDTVKVDKVAPQKKEYVDIESVAPSELGHYQVENVELSEANKIKWIFLTLKNGDFVSAKELIANELSKDSNNAELQFADLMASKNIKTQEEFFSNISNFLDKEKVENILKYASKEFAEYFVDSWENLIIRIDSEEYYNAFLLYLAKYTSPNRDNFVSHAENKAVETLNEELIDKVLKCFSSNEVERFIEFYFMLAQKSDNQEYYKKILDIDEGHVQSNLALLLQHFKTDEEKLTYRNREELEGIFKFLNEETRGQFVGAIVNIIMPVAFLNTKQATEQLDFYLSYVANDEQLVKLLKSISGKFLEMNFFKLAEKYLTIAISKDKNDAELYWSLIKIKAHCKNDNELIMSGIKISKMPEWETLISLSNEKETEKYAEIASKINLYNGEHLAFKQEMLDREEVTQKLQEFLDRNNKILLEMEEQEGLSVSKGVRYFQLQLQPFENYLATFKETNDFASFENLMQKLNQRLEFLNLTLETSVNVTLLQDKEEGLKGIFQERIEDATKKDKQRKDKTEKTSKMDFWKKFLYGFLELFPLLFTTLLLVVAIFEPKEVYLYFSQEFLVLTLMFSVLVGAINLIVFTNLRHKTSKGWNIANLLLFFIGLINLVLFCINFYFAPNSMEINNTNEFEVLMNNAKYSHLTLNEDIDLAGKKWKSVNFSGTLDGNGHKITNITFANQQNVGLINNNTGTISNLELELAEKTYENVVKFGGLVASNSGTIKNCKVTGTISIDTNIDAVIGGLVGKTYAGDIEYCNVDLKITLNATAENVKFGGLVGQVCSGKNETSILKNEVASELTLTTKSSILYVGGLVGELEHMEDSKVDISINHSDVKYVLSGTASKYVVGGFVGQGNSNSKNNYATGLINSQDLEGVGYVGGLYGEYDNSVLTSQVEYSYSTVTLSTSASSTTGGIVGGLGGKFNSCFSTQEEIDLAGPSKFSGAKLTNCFKSSQMASPYYDSRLNFDTEIWQISSSTYPKFR